MDIKIYSIGLNVFHIDLNNSEPIYDHLFLIYFDIHSI